MGVTRSTLNADRRPRAARSASPRVVPGATSLRGLLLCLRALLHRGGAAEPRAPVELSPLAHALDVLAHHR